MRKHVFAGMLCALVFAGCSSAHPQAVKHAAGHEVALYLAPAVTGEENFLRVEVRGARIPDIPAVAVSMPDMNMPAERIALTSSGTGSYHAENVRFSMSGKWHVTVLERHGTSTAELTSFDVQVR